MPFQVIDRSLTIPHNVIVTIKSQNYCIDSFIFKEGLSCIPNPSPWELLMKELKQWQRIDFFEAFQPIARDLKIFFYFNNFFWDVEVVKNRIHSHGLS